MYYDQQKHNYFTNYHNSYLFRHYRVIHRQPVINTLPSYTSISDAAVGNRVYNYFVLRPTNAQLSHSYMFGHYRAILRQPVINTLPSYTSMSNAAVGNTIYNLDVSYRFYASSQIIVVEISIL